MQPRKRITRKRGERGNALIEFALMSTVLLGMTLGVADFGRIFAMGDKATAAAAAGTSYGALSPSHYTDMNAMENASRNDLGSFPGSTVVADRTCRCLIGGDPVSCAEDPDVVSCPAGQTRKTYIEVVVTIPFRSLSGVPIVPGVTTVKGRSIVRVE
jgi:Flp pilus assembly protein TadG